MLTKISRALVLLGLAFNVTVASAQGVQLRGDHPQAYTVVKGDTLYSIARKFGIEPHDIARENNISLSSTLLAGTTLQIPR